MSLEISYVFFVWKQMLLVLYRKDVIDDVMDLLLPEATESTASTNDHLSYQMLNSCCEDGVEAVSSPRSMLTKQLESKIPGAAKLMHILFNFFFCMPCYMNLIWLILVSWRCVCVSIVSIPTFTYHNSLLYLCAGLLWSQSTATALNKLFFCLWIMLIYGTGLEHLFIFNWSSTLLEAC